MAEPQQVEEFVRLVTSHEARLRAFVLSLVPNYADADDILQKAYIVLLKRFDQFQPGTSFMSWAGQVVYFTTLQHKRQQHRSKIRFGDAFFDAVAKVALQDDTSEILNARIRTLGECISKLKPEHQAMLRARYIEDKSVTQVAEFFKRSAESTYKVLSRTRRLLHECVSFKLRTEAVHGR